MQTRAKFPINMEVEFRESGQEATVVSISEHDEDRYGDPRRVCVRMNGQVIMTSVGKIQPRSD